MKSKAIRPRSVYPINMGCAKNQVDLEKMLGELKQAQYVQSDQAEDSEFLLLNTCGFIDSAKEESIDAILEMVAQRRAGQKIIVTGCLSQRYQDELKKEIPEIDFWGGTYRPGNILTMLGNQSIAELCQRESPRRLLTGPLSHHAYLKIAEGCNRNCSFCAIPGIRGKQRSLDIPELVEEAQWLYQNGVKEISLIAQDLTYYGREKNGPNTNLETLVRALLSDTDIPWIRLMYAYPAFIDDSLLECMQSSSRLCHYLDMPIQHANHAMLQRMRRHHSAQELRQLLQHLRQQVPDIALRTTVLVGFPGETEAEFQDLLELAADIRFERLGGFVYSPEDGTHAETLSEPQVPRDIAEERLNQLLEQQQRISTERNEALIGQTLPVILDEVAEESDFHFYARTQWDAPEVDQVVRVLEGNGTPGDIRMAKIVDSSTFELDAVLTEN